MARQYYYNEQGGSDVTAASNISWADAVALTFTPDASTDYYLFFSGLIGNSATTNDVQYRVLEGANVIATGNWEPKDTSPQEYQAFAGFLRHSEGGSPSSRTFKIQIKLEISGPTARIRSAKLTAIRHETGDVFEETTAAFTTASASGTSVESISTSSANYQNDSYIFFACAKMQAGTTAATIQVALDRPTPAFSIGTAFAIAEYSDTTSALHKMLGFHVAANGSHNLNGGSLALRATTPAGTTSVSDRRILALKVTGDSVYSDYDINGSTGTTTSYVDQYTYTPTVATSGDHLAFLALCWDSSSATSSAYTDFTVAGSVITESVKEFSGAIDTHMSVGIASLTSGSNAIKARAKGESAITVSTYEISFVVWQLASSARTLSADSGSFSFSGTAATLKLGRRVDAAGGSFAFSGSAATLKRGYKVIAAAASFSFTGQAATLKIGRRLDAAAASFAFTGTASTLKVGYKVAADAASFAFTGTAASFSRTYQVAAGSGSFSFSGQSATLKVGYKLSAVAGSFTWSGTDATLTLTPVGTKSIVADSGSFSFSGTASTLKVNRRLDATAASFAFTGSAATLKHGRKVIADAASFSFTGTAATLRRTYRLDAGSGAFVFTGSAATLSLLAAGKVLDAGSGTFNWTGSNATLLTTRRLSADAGSFLFNGSGTTEMYIDDGSGRANEYIIFARHHGRR